MFSIHFYCMAQLACVPPNAEFTLMQTEPEKTKKKSQMLLHSTNLYRLYFLFCILKHILNHFLMPTYIYYTLMLFLLYSRFTVKWTFKLAISTPLGSILISTRLWYRVWTPYLFYLSKKNVHILWTKLKFMIVDVSFPTELNFFMLKWKS